MIVEEHIHNLLFEHDCVIIPDFGGLITHYASARINPVKHTFSPPSKHIAFNEKLQLNDGLLISTFAFSKKITNEEAQVQVNSYVQQMQEALRATHHYEMKGVGIFRHNQEQKIQFEYIPADNLFNHSFGLPELLSRPVPAPDVTESLRTFIKEKNNLNPAAIPQKTWSRRLRRVYDSVAVMAIAGLSITALYVISLQNESSQSSLNPFAVFDLAATNNLSESRNDFADTEFRPAAFETDAFPTEDLPVNPEPKAEQLVDVLNTDITNASSSPVSTPPINAASLVTNANPKTVVVPAVPKEKSAPVTVKKLTGVAPGSKTPITVKLKTERYYVIAGGYSTLQNAHYSRKVANKHGAQGKVILPFASSKLYRVSIADFDNKDEALAYLPQLKNKYGKNIWILNY